MAKGGYADLGDYDGRRRLHERIEESEGDFMDPVDYIREAHTARTEIDRLRRQRDQARFAWRAHRAMCTCLKPGEVPVAPLDRDDDDGWRP